ncbi:MAG: hypothetical protein HY902_04920 [Deltaproteobacteria bacterium]|nr:hypothetical protein [Deltaproteobacteria bacterium]
MNFSFSRNLVPTALALLASACVAGGGGGGGGFSGVGGAEGTACDKNFFNQGCYGASAMQCDGTWKKMQDCLPPTSCIEDTTPGASTKIASCKAASTNTGADTSSGSDATGGGDTNTTKNDTSTGGSDTSVQEILACMQSKCSSQWSACQSNNNCKKTLDCMVACGGTCDPQTCITTSDEVALQLFSAVGTCGNSAGCLGSASVCGNGKCDAGESTSSCPSDCKIPNQTVCGNGTCESGESASSCPSDCKTNVAVCGNGTCESGESASNCPSDCETTCTPKCSGKYCGDSDSCGGKCSGPCTNGGTCTSSKTCTAPKPVCGNGKCESGETSASCASDCGGGGGQCGNLVCESGENTSNCNQDCDPTTVCLMNACGDSVMACLSDAKCGALYSCIGQCPSGDNACAQKCATTAGSAATNLFSSMAQCMQSSGCTSGNPAQCGNGACESGETAASCPSDCGGGGGHPCDSACGGQAASGCWCDSACKQNGDCCDLSGKPTAKTCTGSTCADCK